ncbi:MAG: CAP domain-containing protein [Cyanobacteria bacterium P01_A01_bin.37]
MSLGAFALTGCSMHAIAQASERSQSLSPIATELLATHNRYRDAVNVPPLEWSDTLAASAQAWADELANRNAFSHSSSDYGENLWKGTASRFSPTHMVETWGDEAAYFIPNAVFPEVSTTGTWSDVGHYTQIVWGDTTDVGCAIATGHGWDVLVCHYSPRGNDVGERPF